MTGYAAAQRSLRFAFLLPGGQKRAPLIGMGNDGKQGDSRTSTTPRGARLADDSYRLVGHKWFFLCRAMRTSAGAGKRRTILAFVPRFPPDGQTEPVRSTPEDKLGGPIQCQRRSRSFRDAVGWRLGEEGEGIGIS